MHWLSKTRCCYINALAAAIAHLHFGHHFNQVIFGHTACKHARQEEEEEEEEEKEKE